MIQVSHRIHRSPYHRSPRFPETPSHPGVGLAAIPCLLSLATIPCILLAATTAAATTLQFAGFSFIADYADLKARYPHTSALLAADPRQLDAVLVERLSEVRRDDMEIRPGTLAQLRSGEGLVLTLALDDEIVLIEEIGGVHKIVVDLNAHGLVFDMNESAIVASIPVSVEYLDATDYPPTDDYVRTIVRNLYLGDLDVNLFTDFLDLLTNLSIPARDALKIGVVNVTVAPEAQTEMPEELLQSPMAARNLVAQAFAKYLSHNQRVSVLPYTKGHAIGNKISARFADGRATTLTIPDPDYSVDLTLQAFKKVTFDERPSGSSFVYGTYLHLRVYESLTERSFADLSLKNGVTKLVPSSQRDTRDWPAYLESLRALMNGVTQQMATPTRSWVGSHASDANALSQLRSLASVMEKCR